MSDLNDDLVRLAATPVLLVAVDFDGTLAPIVDDPAEATMLPRARRALALLSRLAHTHVAVISGRALADLDARLGPAASEVLRVGSHGSEFEPAVAGQLDAATRRLLEAAGAAMEAAASGLSGVTVETKDASVALHYRRAARADAAEALRRLAKAMPHLRRLEPPDRLRLRRGKRVAELMVVDADKGRALARLRAELGATGVVCLGDDRTDEDAFAVLGADDIGVKIGPGPTVAAARLPDPAAAAEALVRLAEARRRTLTETVPAAIDDLALLSDRRTAALVAPDGTICWLAPERFDRPALFASLLGGPTAGRWSIRPADTTAPGQQAYRPGTLVLVTAWEGLELHDALVPVDGGTLLVREIHPRRPGIRVRIVFAPRPDFARKPAHLEPVADGLTVHGTAVPHHLESPDVTWSITPEGKDHVASANVTLAAPLRLVLRVATGSDARPPASLDDACRPDTVRLQLPARWAGPVEVSARVLRGLVYAPSGALVAAASTSLPETPGGVRNWDYRYCWPRDAAHAYEALIRLGDTPDALRFVDWLADLLGNPGGGPLRPLYGVGGEVLPGEGELGHLVGYLGSRPVRVGNAAAEQLQLDVPGAVLELLWSLACLGMPAGERWPDLVRGLVDSVATRWTEADAGIWEHRHAVRHQVHSKVMAWVAVDRAMRLGRQLGWSPDPRWPTLRDQIAADVLTHGWDPAAEAFTTAYGSPEPDAATLWVLLSGLLPPEDARVVATVAFVERHLRHGPTVFRYHYADGLAGSDAGGFHICTAWLVEALWRTGRRTDAMDLFEELLSCGGPTGLMSEMFDPDTLMALGNTPQAYSHAGLIRAALVLQGRWDLEAPSPARAGASR